MNTRWATILVSDVVGSTREMNRDEERAIAVVREDLAFFEKVVLDNGGTVYARTGDGLEVCFESLESAVRAAWSMQSGCVSANSDAPLGDLFFHRIGIASGEATWIDGRPTGEVCKVAKKLEGIAPEGGIALTDECYEQVRVALGIVGLHKGKSVKFGPLMHPVRELEPNKRAVNKRIEQELTTVKPIGPRGPVEPISDHGPSAFRNIAVASLVVLGLVLFLVRTLPSLNAMQGPKEIEPTEEQKVAAGTDPIMGDPAFSKSRMDEVFRTSLRQRDAAQFGNFLEQAGLNSDSEADRYRKMLAHIRDLHNMLADVLSATSSERPLRVDHSYGSRTYWMDGGMLFRLDSGRQDNPGFREIGVPGLVDILAAAGAQSRWPDFSAKSSVYAKFANELYSDGHVPGKQL